MEEAYKNWKLLLESEDADNVNLALSLALGLEIDKNIIELDVLAAYFHLIHKKNSRNIQAEEVAQFVDWGKKSGLQLWKKAHMQHWEGSDRVFNIMDNILALNPRLQPTTVYKHTLLLYRFFFEYFLEHGKHDRLDSDSWLACFKAHNLFREENNKIHVRYRWKKVPDILFSWDFITHLSLDNYFFKFENIGLLYQLKNLEELQTYRLNMVQSVHLDFNRLPQLRKFTSSCEAGYNFYISTGDYLTILNLYAIREAELEKILACTPNLKSLTINKYKGDKLPPNISQLQHLEEFSMQEVNKWIDLSELKNLPKLSVLNLQGARFRQLPLLVDLVDLNISYCDLDALPFVLNEMPRLEQLNISYNRIFFFKPIIIRQLLGQLKTLNIQSAFASEKGDDEIMQIAAEIGSQTSINPPKQRA